MRVVGSYPLMLRTRFATFAVLLLIIAVMNAIGFFAGWELPN